MIAQIVADVHFLHFSVLVLHFQEDVFEKVIVVLLLLHVRDERGRLRRSGRVLQVAVAILKNDGLRKGGFVVQTGAGGAVATSADFDVKRTVDFVLFRSENRGQIFRHDGGTVIGGDRWKSFPSSTEGEVFCFGFLLFP